MSTNKGLTGEWINVFMCTSLHQETSVLQEYRVIPLVHHIKKVLNKFERIWNEHIWTSSEQVWTHFNTFERVLNKFGHIWTHLNKFWTSLNTNEHIWTHLNTYNNTWTSFEQVWTQMNTFEHIWTHLNKFWTSLWISELVCELVN